MQATIREFSSATGAGSVLLDDGTVLPFDHHAFDASGLRVLRFGQRVSVRTDRDADGRRVVIALDIVTLH